MKENRETIRFAVCMNNTEYPASLELHKIYRVLPDEDDRSGDDFRIVDESGESYLHPAKCFALVEPPQAVEESLLNEL